MGSGPIKLAIFVASVIACIATLSVILSFLCFAPIRRKRFMRFIFCMSVCDFGMSIITLFGFPESGSNLCFAQGILCIYFSLASWFWTTSLSYVTYCIIMKGRCLLSDIQMHILCWGTPLLLAMLPFSNATYGNNINNSVQWCLIIDASNSPQNADVYWSYISYFIWLFLTAFFMLYWAIRVRLTLLHRRDTLSNAVLTMYDRVVWYPFTMIAFWSLNYICIDVPQFQNNLFAGLSMLSGVSYGTATAFIFWWKSEECRARWKLLLTGSKESPTICSCCNKGDVGPENKTTVVPIDFNEDDIGMVTVFSTMHVPRDTLDSTISKEDAVAAAAADVSRVSDLNVSVVDEYHGTRWNSGFAATQISFHEQL